jgi:hypothetical protein
VTWSGCWRIFPFVGQWSVLIYWIAYKQLRSIKFWKDLASNRE